MATDSNDGQGIAPSSNLSVYADPAVSTPAVNPSAIDTDDPITLNVSTTGGGGPLTFAWHGLPPGCVSSQANFTCRPTAPGWTNVSVTVTDSNGVSATSPTSLLHVNGPLSGTLSQTPASPPTGARVVFTARPDGGSGANVFA